MEGIKWKVCGLRDNIVDVLTLQPDYVGFIFYKKSPRYVGDNFEMPDFDDSKVKRVGVFVNEPWEFVYDISQKYELDYVQLHGDETSEYCQRLKVKQISEKGLEFEYLDAAQGQIIANGPEDDKRRRGQPELEIFPGFCCGSRQGERNR